ncbi:ABC transporter permease [Methylobacterium sp. 092160098-2]|uniref:ABC transporter permease n=1 Tax=unclassified Methylobacterium TaxID=2615210 RepID=UPI0003459A0A|nr:MULTISPECIES: ABC transporter permease [unclassified Methylobacterium]AWV15948.1 multidrug ABC transporter substrate-binding protein [Methylobacterium sp. XJLW]KOX54609.1 multidrug ABC transporter substrate-binding protein [Streptomyces purpurogeneiscleroticus]MDE4911326.1 ABC transporter permease [Methylobacterium sp. 092160098-2]
MPLVMTLALRNLLQDRLRFVAAVTGIVLSVVLILVQMGLFYGFGRMVTLIVDHTAADLWIVSKGTQYFEDISILDAEMRQELSAVDGVSEAVPVVAGFSAWLPPDGGLIGIFIIASDPVGGLAPWNIVEGGLDDLATAGTVSLERSYADQLGVSARGETAQVRGHPVTVGAVTSGLRSFTTRPYVFTDFRSARSYVGLPANLVTYFLIRAKPGADIARIRQEAQARVSGMEALTPEQFRARSLNFWLYRTGAGAALVAGALLSIIVGTVIIAQTLYSSTKEHLYEFAMVRAIGASNRYIYRVIAFQALVNALIGLSVATVISIGVERLTATSVAPVIITPALVAVAFALTLLMCVASGIASIVRIIRVDPASVLTR